MSPTADTPIAEIPGDLLRVSILDRLRSLIGDSIADSLIKPSDDLWVRVKPEAWRRTAQVLRDEMGFEYFCFLSAMDWMPSPFGKSEDDPTDEAPPRDDTIKQGYAGGDTRFQVLARLYSLKQHVGIILKVDVEDRGAVDSWVPVFAGANWHERETWEMFGISFTGHPDLRKMYLPGDFEGNPLRKDFPLLARIIKPWPGIVDVEPLPGAADDEQEGAVAE